MTADFRFDGLNTGIRPLILTPAASNAVFVVIRMPAGRDSAAARVSLEEIGRATLGDPNFHVTAMASHVREVAEPMAIGVRFLLFSGTLILILAIISISDLALVRVRNYRLEFALRLSHGTSRLRIIARGLTIAAGSLIAIILISGAVALLAVLICSSQLDLALATALGVVAISLTAFLLAVLAPCAASIMALTRQSPWAMLERIE